MIRIAFEKTDAFLPEFIAYKEYCQTLGLSPHFFQMGGAVPDSDILWQVCGVKIKPRSEAFLVHEYQSLSVPPFSKLKNFIKKKLNYQPDVRVFLTPQIQNELGFHFQKGCDFYRDMGVHKSFFDSRAGSKDFVFLYIGSTCYQRQFSKTYEMFRKTNLPTLIIGEKPKELMNQHTGRIEFTGRISYLDVPKEASRARFGVNCVPSAYPYQYQTSTKLLEYCALGLNVITTYHAPTQNFEKQRGAKFLTLNSYQIPSHFEEFAYETPSVNDLEWNSILKKTQMFEQIIQLYNMKKQGLV